MLRRVLALSLKEWRDMSRSQLVYLVVVLPVLFSFLWGYCASLDVRGVPVAVVDHSATAESRAVVRGLESSGCFVPTEAAPAFQDLYRRLCAGEAGMGVIVPARFATDLRRGRPAPIEVVADGTDLNLASVGASYAARTIEATVAPRPARTHGTERAGVRAATSRWYNESLRGLDYLLINAIAYNLLWAISLPAYSLVSEKQRGTLGTLAASPASAVEVWLGRCAPQLLVVYWAALVQIGLTVFAFGVPFRGDAGLLLLGIGLFAVGGLNLGCALARFVARADHLPILCNVYVLVLAIFSGFFVPTASLPGWARSVGEVMPLKHAIVFLRAVFLKGAGAGQLERELVALAGFAAGTTVVAVASLRALLRPAREERQ